MSETVQNGNIISYLQQTTIGKNKSSVMCGSGCRSAITLAISHNSWLLPHWESVEFL